MTTKLANGKKSLSIDKKAEKKQRKFTGKSEACLLIETHVCKTEITKFCIIIKYEKKCSFTCKVGAEVVFVGLCLFYLFGSSLSSSILSSLMTR